VNAQQVFPRIVVRLEMALVRVADSLADAMRRWMSVVVTARRHPRRNVHDALQRCSAFFPLFDVAHEVEEFDAMLREEFAFELDVARGKPVMDAWQAGTFVWRTRFAGRRVCGFWKSFGIFPGFVM